MHDRIRELRKNHLHMSQTEFGVKLGVSRSVIKNIELGALARPDQKLSLIKLMCKEFSVSEEWLLYGTEPMFVEPDTFSLDQYAKDRGASELELAVAKAYFDLPQDVRSQMLAKLKSLLAGEAEAAAELGTTVHERTEPDIAAELAELKRQNQDLAAKVAAMEEEDALLGLTDGFSISPTESAGNLNQRAKK